MLPTSLYHALSVHANGTVSDARVRARAGVCVCGGGGGGGGGVCGGGERHRMDAGLKRYGVCDPRVGPGPLLPLFQLQLTPPPAPFPTPAARTLLANGTVWSSPPRRGPLTMPYACACH